MMSTLRELWRRVEQTGARQFSPEAYAVIEKLVERMGVLEALTQSPMLVDVPPPGHQFGGEIGRLQKKCDTLRRQKAQAIDARVIANEQLAKARAEIARLELRCDCWAGRYRRAQSEARVVRELSSDAIDAASEMTADAEIGRLVCGMRVGTQLRRIHPHRDPDRPGPPGWSAWECSPYKGRYYVFVESSIDHLSHKADPAEALRAIQETAE